MLKNGDSEDHIMDDRVDREGCDQSCKQQQAATLPRVSPCLLNAIFHESIFRDGPVDLFEALPVLGRNMVVRWLQHAAPIQKKYCFKIATLSQISGLNAAILTHKIMGAKRCSAAFS